MTKAARKASTAKTPTSNEPGKNGRTGQGLAVERQTIDEPKEKALARTALRPTVKAGITILELVKPMLGELHLMSLIDELQVQAKAATEGNLGRAEGMLMVQAHTLDALFNDLARRSMANMGAGYLPAADTYMKLALKAQSQCRCSLEALAEIKNPRAVAFIKQQNLANGPQQVNNGEPDGISGAVRAGARAGENSLIPPNKLLEQAHGERLDFATQDPAIDAHSGLETVGAVNGAEDSSGQTPRSRQCK